MSWRHFKKKTTKKSKVKKALIRFFNVDLFDNWITGGPRDGIFKKRA